VLYIINYIWCLLYNALSSICTAMHFIIRKKLRAIPLHYSPYIVWIRLFMKTYTNQKLNPIFMQHICAYKLTTTYIMILIYFLVNIHINNQSSLYKVNSVVGCYPQTSCRNLRSQFDLWRLLPMMLLLGGLLLMMLLLAYFLLQG
jgi:hypothetical protein